MTENVVDRIDYDLLQKQHAALIKLLWALPDHELWGLVSLLEDMIDQNDAHLERLKAIGFSIEFEEAK